MSIFHRVGAYWELWKRYRAVWCHFWRLRKKQDGGLFNEQEAHFLPAALSLQERPVSSTARWTGRILIALVLVALLWSILGKIDIIVNATGKIIPSGHTKTIESVEVAAVRALHVEEGQRVKAGDILIELDTSASDSERDKALGDASVATMQMARSRALLIAVDTLKPPHLEKDLGIGDAEWQAEEQHLQSQYRDFLSKLTRLDGEIIRYAQALPLSAQRAADYKILSREHDVSEHAWLEKEQARVDLQGQLTDARNQRTALIAQTKKEAQDALTDGSKMSASSGQDARRAGEHGKLLQLVAPIDGTVQQLTVFTVGGVVSAAQPLMLIVPRESNVEVEAFLENKDVGFVQEGQRAEVKIDAFDYTRYGTVQAHVTHVSRDAIQDDKKGLIYSCKVLLDKSELMLEGQAMPLSAGMSVNVEIKTGERRIIGYILSPLIQHQREALHER